MDTTGKLIEEQVKEMVNFCSTCSKQGKKLEYAFGEGAWTEFTHMSSIVLNSNPEITENNWKVEDYINDDYKKYYPKAQDYVAVLYRKLRDFKIRVDKKEIHNYNLTFEFGKKVYIFNQKK
jgi:hypothetical protein